MNRKKLIGLGLILALSIPFNVYAATTIGSNLTVGDGTADVTQDGEDAYIEGTFEVDGASRFDGATTYNSTITVGVDDTGYDVTFYGATASSNLLWDESADRLDANDSTIRLISTDADAAADKEFVLFRNSASPAAFDVLGGLAINGEDDASNETTYTQFTGAILSTTNGSEQGAAGFKVQDGAGNLDLAGSFSIDSNVTSLILGDALGGGGPTSGKITTPSSSNGNVTVDPDGTGKLLVGVDDTGKDVIFYGATSGSNLTWDESADQLDLNNAGLRLASTADSTTGPDLILYHNDPSADPNDYTGTITFRGEDDGSNTQDYVRFISAIYDETDTTEDGLFAIQFAQAGTLKAGLTLSESGGTPGRLRLTLGDSLGGGGFAPAEIQTENNGDLYIHPQGTGELILGEYGAGVQFEDDIVASDEASGVTRGVVMTRVIDGDTVKALMDTTTNNLTTFDANVTIHDVTFISSNSAGTAGTVDIGTDANYLIGADQDCFVAAVDANIPQTQRGSIASNACSAGMFSSAGGDLTITSSTNLTASSWAGMVVIEYSYTNGL